MALAAAAGCGASAPGSSTTSATTTSSHVAGHPGSRQAPSRRRRPARPRGAPVGTTRRVDAGTSVLSVTVSKVLNPLRGSGAAVIPGTHAVGVMVSVRDDSGATYDSTASGDLSVLTSAGAAAPLFIRRGVCETQLADFESLIGVGETRAGCVGFSVGRGARILAVRFSPHSRAPGSVAWR